MRFTPSAYGAPKAFINRYYGLDFFILGVHAAWHFCFADFYFRDTRDELVQDTPLDTRLRTGAERLVNIGRIE